MKMDELEIGRRRRRRMSLSYVRLCSMYDLVSSGYQLNQFGIMLTSFRDQYSTKSTFLSLFAMAGHYKQEGLHALELHAYGHPTI
jgi:hypothetical protein